MVEELPLLLNIEMPHEDNLGSSWGCEMTI